MGIKRRIRFNFWTVVTLVVFVLFALFMVYPLGKLLLSGFRDADTGQWTLDNFKTFFGKKYYTNAIRHSLIIAFGVTGITLVIGTVLAYLMTCFELRGTQRRRIALHGGHVRSKRPRVHRKNDTGYRYAARGARRKYAFRCGHCFER